MKNKESNISLISQTGPMGIEARFESHGFLRYQLSKLGIPEERQEEILFSFPDCETYGEILEKLEGEALSELAWSEARRFPLAVYHRYCYKKNESSTCKKYQDLLYPCHNLYASVINRCYDN